MSIKGGFSLFGLELFQAIASLLHIPIYAAVQIACNESNPSVPDAGLIYDFLPVSPILCEVGGRYNERWTFPDDYVLDATYPGNTTMAVAMDVSGSHKAYEYGNNQILINCGWSFTITKEGSIIYFGPKRDDRSAICILVPLGWSLDGLLLTEDMEVIRSITFPDATWEHDTAYARQMFRILYDTDSSRPKLIIQEVTWDTDSFDPLVKTQFPDEHMHRYDLKSYRPYWYQATAVVPTGYKYVPTPVYGQVRRMQMQFHVAMGRIDALKDKYDAESAKFDQYRNPDLVP
ncbi:hypothetical protein LCGC14_2688160 [marine sediment metagenome]|uniref:Uncharacterized protein n=1 Tax=marine sediment metagenome TaxID=412755 RepID=A0A0F9A6V2_9ZZZZ